MIASIEQTIEQIVRRVIREELAGINTKPVGHVTIASYAAARSISPSTVRAAIRDGRLPSTKIGRAVRVPADAEIGASTTRIDTAADRVERRLGLVGGRR